jgi:tetratricopeptide (TPR) repeat protein
MPELRVLYQEAFDAFARQEYDAAITLYHRVIEVDPSFALAYHGLSEAYSRSGQLDEAVETIQKAIGLEPEESLFHTSLSRFLQMQGKIPEAETAAAVASQLQSRGP